MKNNTIILITWNLFVTLFILGSCKPKVEGIAHEKKVDIYKIPEFESDSIVVRYSENAKPSMILKAKKQYQYHNKDMCFPKGMVIDFYDEKGKMYSNIKADSAYYIEKQKEWHVYGNVVVNSLHNNKKLKTQKLFWSMEQEKMWTDKYVEITDNGQLLTGTGLRAKDDFSEYEILNISGIISLE